MSIKSFLLLNVVKTITVTTTPTFGGGRCRGGVKKRGEKEVDEDQGGCELTGARAVREIESGDGFRGTTMVRVQKKSVCVWEARRGGKKSGWLRCESENTVKTSGVVDLLMAR